MGRGLLFPLAVLGLTTSGATAELRGGLQQQAFTNESAKEELTTQIDLKNL